MWYLCQIRKKCPCLHVDTALHQGTELGNEQGLSFSPNLPLWPSSLVQWTSSTAIQKSPEHIRAWYIETTILIIVSFLPISIMGASASHLTCLNCFFTWENGRVMTVPISQGGCEDEMS